MRQPRSYGALHETHREVEEQQNSPAATRPTRNYGALHETQHQVDEKQNSPAQAPENHAGPANILRSWTHHGGMYSQQQSANKWIEQNYEIRAKMAESGKPGAGREGEGAKPSQENDRDLQEARAAVEDARRREAAERARTQERDRGGPER